MIKKLLAPFAPLFGILAVAGMLYAPVALAQSGAQYPPGTVLGNPDATQKPAKVTTLTNLFDRSYCSTVGYVIARTTGAWTCSRSLPLQASWYGVVCDSSTSISSSLQAAITAADAAGGVRIEMPAPTTLGAQCRHTANVFLNSMGAPGASNVLPAPGIQLFGQGAKTTVIDNRVNGYAISLNPDWEAAHKALSTASPNSGGSLASNTYYVQITVTTPVASGSTEVTVTTAQPFVVTGPTGRINVTLQPLNTGYCYNIYIGTTATPVNYAVVSGADAVCLGGVLVTVPINSIGSSHSPPDLKRAAWQKSRISNIGFANDTSAAGVKGISAFKQAYSTYDNIYMNNVTGGDAFTMLNYAGDADGSLNINLKQWRVSTAAGWCMNAAGLAPELSYLTVEDFSCDLAGTAPSNLKAPTAYNTGPSISSISIASPGVVTTGSAHSILNNDEVYVMGVSGSMTQLPTAFYRAVNVTSTTMQLADLVTGTVINTTGFTPYTSGGTVALAWRPPTQASNTGGGFAYTGLSGKFKASGCTQANNVCLFVSEAATSNNLHLELFTSENTVGKGYYIGALDGGKASGLEILSAPAFGSTIGGMQLGTGYNAGGVQHFIVDSAKVRSNITLAKAFEQFRNTSYATAGLDTNRIRNVTWASYDFSGQTRFTNFAFDPVPGNISFAISAVNTAKVNSVGIGSCLPLKLAVTGEYVCVKVPTTVGFTGTIGPQAASTSYNIYSYNSAALTTPYIISFEAATAGPVLDEHGYFVKSTAESTKLWIGRVTTDGAGAFQTSSVQESGYPIQSVSPIATVNGAIRCPTCAVTTTTINTTAPITGGGDLSANRTLALSFPKQTNSLGGNVTISNAAFTDGPVAPSTTTAGVWFASGTISLADTAGNAGVACKLWDNTTVIASANASTTGVSVNITMALSGYITNPAANIRISCKSTLTTTLFLANASAQGKDSTVSAIQLQ